MKKKHLHLYVVAAFLLSMILFETSIHAEEDRNQKQLNWPKQSNSTLELTPNESDEKDVEIFNRHHDANRMILDGKVDEGIKSLLDLAQLAQTDIQKAMIWTSLGAAYNKANKTDLAINYHNKAETLMPQVTGVSTNNPHKLLNMPGHEPVGAYWIHLSKDKKQLTVLAAMDKLKEEGAKVEVPAIELVARIEKILQITEQAQAFSLPDLVRATLKGELS